MLRAFNGRSNIFLLSNPLPSCALTVLTVSESAVTSTALLRFPTSSRSVARDGLIHWKWKSLEIQCFESG